MQGKNAKPFEFNRQQLRKICKLLQMAIEEDVERACGEKNKALVKQSITQRMSHVPTFIASLVLDVRQLRELPESELNLPWYAGQLAGYFETLLNIRVTPTEGNAYSQLLQLIFSCAKVIKSPTTRVYRYAEAGIDSTSNDPRLAFKLLSKKERSIAESGYWEDLSNERATNAAKKETIKNTPPE